MLQKINSYYWHIINNSIKTEIQERELILVLREILHRHLLTRLILDSSKSRVKCITIPVNEKHQLLCFVWRNQGLQGKAMALHPHYSEAYYFRICLNSRIEILLLSDKKGSKLYTLSCPTLSNLPWRQHVPSVTNRTSSAKSWCHHLFSRTVRTVGLWCYSHLRNKEEALNYCTENNS
jgi:hypothetical protein